MSASRLKATPEAVAALRKLAEAAGDPIEAIDAVEGIRKARGLNCGQMAEVLALPKSHYSEFLHGKRLLPIGAVQRAARIGVPCWALLQLA